PPSRGAWPIGTGSLSRSSMYVFMLARKIATPKRDIRPVARIISWFVKKDRRVMNDRFRTLCRSCWLFRSLGIWALSAFRVASLRGSTCMIWIWFTMSEMQATREKTPDTHATAFATWAPIAAPSEGCFRLAGLLTAAHLRDLGLELEDDRGRPHRAHRHARNPADRTCVGAAGAAVAVAPVGLVVRPLPPDRQPDQLEADDEPDEGAQDARPVADLLLDALRLGHERFVRGAGFVEGLARVGRAFDQLVLLEVDALGEAHREMLAG